MLRLSLTLVLGAFNGYRKFGTCLAAVDWQGRVYMRPLLLVRLNNLQFEFERLRDRASI